MLRIGICLCGMLLSGWVVGGVAASDDMDLLNPSVKLRSHHARIIHLQDLRDRLAQYVSESGETDHLSIYVEDLNTGIHIGINERKQAYLASLLKVPMMIAWFKLDQSQEGLLDTPIRVTPRHFFANDVLAPRMDTPLDTGSYTVRQLIQRMIIDSDNTATIALRSNLNPKHLKEVGEDLGLPDPLQRLDGGDTRWGRPLSCKQYSQVIKALYNATYLDETHSRLALNLLCQSKFSHGIRSILPPGTRAALKYGVLSNALHESGIVYIDFNPYLISVFTYGFTATTPVERPLSILHAVGRIVQAHFEGVIRR